MDKLKDFLKTEPFKMLKKPNGVLRFPFVDPGEGYSANLWDWDSHFSIVGLFGICEYFKDDPDFNYTERFNSVVTHAKGCVLNFLELEQKDGFIPMACTYRGDYADYLFSAHNIGEAVNQHKPFLAQTVLKVIEETGETDWFDVDKLVKYMSYYCENQFDENSGLFFWQDDIMIGIDNNPTVFGRPEKSCADIYLNCFIYAELVALGKVLTILSDRRARAFIAKANALKKSINAYMYDERSGLYYSLDIQSKTRQIGVFHKGLGCFWKGLLLKNRIWACLLPMTFGISTKDRNERMVKEHFYDDNFVCEYGVRSLAKDEPMFDEKPTSNPSNWLGAIWIVANYCVWKGLLNTGYKKEADELAKRVIKLLKKDVEKNGCMAESYSSVTGKRLLFGGFMSWNCLVIEMIKDLEK